MRTRTVNFINELQQQRLNEVIPGDWFYFVVPIISRKQKLIPDFANDFTIGFYEIYNKPKFCWFDKNNNPVFPEYSRDKYLLSYVHPNIKLYVDDVCIRKYQHLETSDFNAMGFENTLFLKDNNQYYYDYIPYPGKPPLKINIHVKFLQYHNKYLPNNWFYLYKCKVLER